MSDKKRLAIGIDIGGSFFKAGFVTEDGKIVERDRLPVRKERREEFYGQLRELVDEMMSSAGADEIIGVGIGVPGFINLRTGRIEQSPNLQIINGAPIFDDLQDLMPMPVAVDNDANAAAWGEYWVGGGGSAELLVLLTLGSGIGGGIVWRGDIWRGAIGYGGEIGHTVITPGGPPCLCGKRGCIEAEFGDTAFARKGSRGDRSGPRYHPGRKRRRQNLRQRRHRCGRCRRRGRSRNSRVFEPPSRADHRQHHQRPQPRPGRPRRRPDSRRGTPDAADNGGRRGTGYPGRPRIMRCPPEHAGKRRRFAGCSRSGLENRIGIAPGRT